jgi:MFS family permease
VTRALAPRPSRIHYAWVALAVTFVTLLVSSGVRSTPSVLIVPLETEFHWSRATISGAISVNILLSGLIGPFAGALIQRFGIRRTAVIAMGTLTAGAVLASGIRQLWQLVFLWGPVVGLGSGMAAMVLGTAVVNRWFVARRGLALGILTASVATGQLVFLPTLASVTTHHGWRSAVLIVAGAALLTVLVIALFMRDDPNDLALTPFGADRSDVEPRAVHGVPGNPIVLAVQVLREGVKSRDFWLLFATFCVCGATTVGMVGTHLIPAAHDHGIPEVRAASLLAAMGVLDLAGTTASGWLTDRWSSQRLLASYYSLRGLGLMMMPYALGESEASLLVVVVWLGLGWVATVPPTVKLATDAFGATRAPIILGWFGVGHQLGAAAAAFGAGWIRTTFGDYGVAFWTAGWLCIGAALLALGVGRRPRGDALPNPAFA